MDLGDERRQFARLDRIVRHVCRDDIGGEFDKIRGGGFRHMFDSKLRGGEALFSKSGAHKNKSDGLCRRPWQKPAKASTARGALAFTPPARPIPQPEKSWLALLCSE